MSFGAYLKQKRTALGLSQRAVATAIGVSHVYLSEVERGTRGPITEARQAALAQVLQVPVEEVVAKSRPICIDTCDAPAAVQQLVLALAERVRRQDLSDEEIKKILAIVCVSC